jgi:hypothetical protein
MDDIRAQLKYLPLKHPVKETGILRESKVKVKFSLYRLRRPLGL